MGKVEESPHFNEIVKLLSSGKGGTYVSNHLKKKYGESISHTTLNQFKKENINIEEKVNQELENIIEETIHDETNKKITSELTAENDKQLVAKETAKQLDGLLKAGKDYPIVVSKMEKEAKDSSSNVTWKDVAIEKRNAIKIYLDYMKSQENGVDVEVNVDSYNLSNEFNTDKMRDILHAKQNRNSGNTE